MCDDSRGVDKTRSVVVVFGKATAASYIKHGETRTHCTVNSVRSQKKKKEKKPHQEIAMNAECGEPVRWRQKRTHLHSAECGCNKMLCCVQEVVVVIKSDTLSSTVAAKRLFRRVDE